VFGAFIVRTPAPILVSPALFFNVRVIDCAAHGKIIVAC
jgi:hypothetical protein